MEEVRAAALRFANSMCCIGAISISSCRDLAPPALGGEDRRALNMAWHRLDAWPDVPPGLARLKRQYLLAPVSNGNISLMVDLARRNDFPWDAILGAEFGPRLQAEAAASILPPPKRSISRRMRLHDGCRAQLRSCRPRRGRVSHRPHRAAGRERAGAAAKRRRTCRVDIRCQKPRGSSRTDWRGLSGAAISMMRKELRRALISCARRGCICAHEEFLGHSVQEFRAPVHCQSSARF